MLFACVLPSTPQLLSFVKKICKFMFLLVHFSFDFSRIPVLFYFMFTSVSQTCSCNKCFIPIVLKTK